MTGITEIAPDVFRISTFIRENNIQMNQFLVRDDEPLLWHTGQRYLFEEVREATASLIDIGTLKWIGFSHFEPDECGSLNEWFQTAPLAEAFCSVVGARVNMTDFALRKASGLQHGETISTGRYSFRFLSTPHLPHGWDAGLLFEETNKTLFCSDVLHQNGNLAALTSSDVIGGARENLKLTQSGPMKNYLPYTSNTESQIDMLAGLKPKTLAIMHGSSYNGDGARVLKEFAEVMKEELTVR